MLHRYKAGRLARTPLKLYRGKWHLVTMHLQCWKMLILNMGAREVLGGKQ